MTCSATSASIIPSRVSATSDLRIATSRRLNDRSPSTGSTNPSPRQNVRTTPTSVPTLAASSSIVNLLFSGSTTPSIASSSAVPERSASSISAGSSPRSSSTSRTVRGRRRRNFGTGRSYGGGVVRAAASAKRWARCGRRCHDGDVELRRDGDVTHGRMLADPPPHRWHVGGRPRDDVRVSGDPAHPDEAKGRLPPDAPGSCASELDAVPGELVTVHVGAADLARLDELAAKRAVSREQLLRQVIDEVLAQEALRGGFGVGKAARNGPGLVPAPPRPRRTRHRRFRRARR